ncbi:MAG: hypothetical protein GXP24_07520 [Planctomycetes bacterium]|nr:hypothetical protein [Planctomycetota bacterium]
MEGRLFFWDEDDNWDPNEKPQPVDDAIVGGNPEVNTLDIFNELTNSGTIDITTGTLQPQGDVTNAGTINIGDGSAILSQLIIGSSNTLSGAGEVVLMNSDNSPGSNATISGGGSEATNGAGHTIRGERTMNLGWINEGIVRAEEMSGDASAVLRLDNTTFTNNDELSSSSGASIALINATYSQGIGGQLIADTDNIAFIGGNFCFRRLARNGRRRRLCSRRPGEVVGRDGQRPDRQYQHVGRWQTLRRQRRYHEQLHHYSGRAERQSFSIWIHLLIRHTRRYRRSCARGRKQPNVYRRVPRHLV